MIKSIIIDRKCTEKPEKTVMASIQKKNLKYIRLEKIII